MTDPEDPEEKNEQELNLFSDQPHPEETHAEPEPGAGVPPADSPMRETPAEAVSGDSTVSPDTPLPVDPAPTPAEEPAEAPAPAADRADGSPVVAPPPPPRKPSSMRPGIVQPRAGRAAFPAAPAPNAVKTHKPLPLALQPSQSLGQMLVAIRNARGMSLEEVAGSTRIRMEYLTELESDVLLKALPPVYVSAYVRKLIEVYDLSAEDSDFLLEKMHGATPKNTEELPDKLIESVNEGALVNEGENKRIRNVAIIASVVIGIIAVAIIWLLVLVIVNYVKSPAPAPGRDPASMTSNAAPPAEEPVSRTVHVDESELDALIVPETPSISVLKMSKVPGIRESL
jgi:transcriptional regulator with XRE-family HTH domain